MTASIKPQFKRLSEVTASELAFVATPGYARRQHAEKGRTIPGVPPGMQAQQLEDGEWVLLCDTSQPSQPPAFIHNKSLRFWTVHASIKGNARRKFQLRLNALKPAGARPPANRPPANQPPATASASSTQYTPEPAPIRAATLGPHVNGGPSAAADQSQDVAAQAPSPSGPSVEQCPTAGEPISMVSGEELLSLEDAALTGPVPFVWKRIYRTSESRDTGLGHGWVYPGVATLTLTSKTVELTADDGRHITFMRPAFGRKSRHLHEGMTLFYESDTRFVLSQAGQPNKLFERLNDQTYRLTQWRHKAYVPGRPGVPARGFALDFHYDTAGRLLRVQGNWGRGLFIERNEQGRIAALYPTNRAGEKRGTPAARYTYDAAGDLIAQHNAAGHGEQYAYSNHVIVQRTLATGYRFYFEWDQLTPAAKCLRQWGDNGYYVYSFTWDPDRQHSSATNSRGHTTHYHYNAFGLITREIDPEGHIHQKQYNDAGQVIVQIDPLGNKTEYQYDARQHLIGRTNSLGQRIQFGYVRDVYDAVRHLYDYTQPLETDEVTVLIDAHGQTWNRQYDARGLMQRVTDPLGTSHDYEYTSDGLLSAVTDPMGRTTHYAWNERAELIRQTDPLGNTLHFGYDDWGQIIEVVAQAAGQDLEQARQAPTRYTYTPTGLIATVTNAQGQSTSFEYNENDQLTQYTDTQGRRTQYRYDDKLSQPTHRIDPAGNVLRYEYDSERNLIALTNENGDQHRFFYDGNERLIKEIGFDGRTQHYKYNAAGHLIQHLDSGEVQTEFERNPLGQLNTKLSRRIGHADAPLERTRYQYDALGQLTETYNQHQYLKFRYDPLGRLLEEQHCDLNAAREQLLSTQKTIAHQYNALGQRIQTTLPDGHTLDYAYDASLGFQAVVWNGQEITSLERDSLGREVMRQQGHLTTHTDYDPQGRLSKQRVTHKENKHSPIQREYGYDRFSNLNSFKDGSDETQYVYDTLNRLTCAQGPTPEFFAFDPAGNLLSVTDAPTSAPGLVKGNRLRIQGDKKFDYDARGNLIQETRGQDGKLKKRYTYNLNNQLIAVQSNQRDHTVSFKYDPLGRRIEKQDAFGTTQYLWTDNLLAQETRNNLTKTYVYEPQSFKPLAQIQDDKVYHYHLDHLGTPRELTNEAGKIVWKAKYKTYGNLAIKEVEEVKNNLRFQGQYFDEETGLHYNRFRYYSPDTGQFINQDPIGLLGGLNSYQYAPNPIQWIDPLGLSCKEGVAPKYTNTKQMLEKYKDEQYPGHPEWSFFGKDVKINYLNDEQRKFYELNVVDGKLVNAITKEPFDTLDGGDAWSGKGKAIFVMDPQGKIYASNSYTVGEFHHSSFLSGQPVAAAGTIEVADGILLSVSNDSGHYQPSQEQNKQFVNELADRGIDKDKISKIKIENYDG